jgi:hypothetical protein
VTQHALHIVIVDDKRVYICASTFYNYRRKLLANDLFTEIIEKVTMTMYRQFGYDGITDARIDSTHVLSNMCNLTRGQLFARTTCNFIGDLGKTDAGAFA